MIRLFQHLYASPPAGLSAVYQGRTVTVRVPGTGEQCGRCGSDLLDHAWRVVDTDETEQGGVLDCGLKS